MIYKIFYAVILVVFLLNAVTAVSTVPYLMSSFEENSTQSRDATSSSVLLQVTTDRASICKYSQIEGNLYDSMEGMFDLNQDRIHKKTITDLSDGVYRYYIKCIDESGNRSGELKAVINVNLPVTAQILLGGSPIKEGIIEVQLITSKIVSETPMLSYSFNGVSYNPIPLFGTGKSWKGYLVVSSSSKEEVGSFKFQGKDLEGVIGNDITNGALFIVDTLKPKTITDIKSIGYDGSIKISWYIDEEIVSYKIYKSTTNNVGFSNFYKTANVKDFTDTDVEKGKTYYYRVSGIDKAGNEGDLSKEVYATALLENVSVNSNGLELRFLGLVDGFLSDIDSVLGDAKDARENLENNKNKEKDLYENLKLVREFDSTKSELDSLRKEVENYKSQTLTKDELEKKLNSGQLKLNTIKRKIPESIIINSEKSVSSDINEEDINSVILTLTPDVSESRANKLLKKSMDEIKESGLKVRRDGYNLELVYLDGTRKEIALIKENIDSNLWQDENISIVEAVPSEVADSVNDLDIKNVEYNVLKENSIIGFGSITKEIVYSIDKHIDLSTLSLIKTILLYDLPEEIENNLFTGYLTFVDFEKGKSYFGIILGILVLTIMGAYFIVVKKKGKLSERLLPIKKRVFLADEHIVNGKVEFAQDIYNSLSNEYKNLNRKEKKVIYNELEGLRKKILGAPDK